MDQISKNKKNQHHLCNTVLVYAVAHFQIKSTYLSTLIMRRLEMTSLDAIRDSPPPDSSSSRLDKLSYSSFDNCPVSFRLLPILFLLCVCTVRWCCKCMCDALDLVVCLLVVGRLCFVWLLKVFFFLFLLFHFSQNSTYTLWIRFISYLNVQFAKN